MAWEKSFPPGRQMHPHRGFYILTYVLDGSDGFRHRDSLGGSLCGNPLRETRSISTQVGPRLIEGAARSGCARERAPSTRNFGNVRSPASDGGGAGATSERRRETSDERRTSIELFQLG